MSANIIKRGNTFKKQLTPEEKARRAAAYEAHRNDGRHFSSFPCQDIALAKEQTSQGTRSNVVLKDAETGMPDAKRKAYIELPPMRAMIGSRSSKEGNLGAGGKNPATRAGCKRSIGLTPGSCDEKKPISETLQKDQQKAVEVVVTACKNAMGLWFDDGAQEECSGPYGSAFTAARAKLQDKFKCKNENELIRKENADKAVLEEVNATARQIFIDKARIPFGEMEDENGKKLAPCAWLSSNVWRMKPGAYNPSIPATQRPTGPPVSEIPSRTSNMPRLKRVMGNIGHEFHLIEYKNGGKPETDPTYNIHYPTEMVADYDEFGNPIVDENGKPKLVPQEMIDFDPMFVGKNGINVNSLVQTCAMIRLTNGGQEQKYGCKLNLAGPVVITAQAVRSANSLLAYEDDIATGLLADEDEGGGEVAGSSINALNHVDVNVTVSGLPGATASTADAPTGLLATHAGPVMNSATAADANPLVVASGTQAGTKRPQQGAQGSNKRRAAEQ